MYVYVCIQIYFNLLIKNIYNKNMCFKKRILKNKEVWSVEKFESTECGEEELRLIKIIWPCAAFLYRALNLNSFMVWVRYRWELQKRTK